MLRTTLGQMLVNDALPEDLRDHDRVLDKKGINALLRTIAEKHPDKYAEISKKLNDVGRVAATEFGGYTFGLEHLKKSKVSEGYQAQIRDRVRKILANPNLDAKKRNELIVKTVGGFQQKQIDDIYDESVKANNPLALQVVSGSRGNKMNLGSLLGSDMLYSDHHDDVIPLPVYSSYSQGLKPVEYWAATYGARRGTLATKFATADAGFLSKQLNQIAHRLMVVGDDADEQTSDRGLPVETSDPDNEGSLLARDVGPYKRNTVLTPKILKHLKGLGHDHLLLRSPLVGGSPDGGVYSRDVGVRERGVLPGRGEQVGLTAAQAVSEPLSQGQLCLAKGTEVRMADWSVKKIEAVGVGDTVLGADKDGRTFPVRVVRAYDNGKRDCVRTVFGVGQSRERVELVSTVDHKLLATTAKWPFAKEDYTLGVFPVGEKTRYFSGLMTRSAAYYPGRFAHQDGICPFLLGLLLGDGCYVDSVNGVHLSCFDPTLIEYLNKSPWLSLAGIKATKLKGHKGYYRISQKEDFVLQDKLGRFLPGTRNPVRKYLEDYALWGKYAHEKVLPEEVWGWRTDDVGVLLAGLFVTDGSVYVAANQANRSKCYISYCSTSRKLVEQVKDLLAFRFAIHTTRVYETSKKRKRTLYSVNICTHTGIRKFAEAIRLEGIKKISLAKALASWQVERDVDHDKFYRKEQRPVGKRHTYDIEVDHPDHLFVLANGLIVSNSAKHSGGVAGQEKAVGGFAAVNQLIQVPKTFKGGATHVELDGHVSDITKAPAGGQYVHVGDKKHYVHPDAQLLVKKGDDVEAGDVVTTGFPNPAKIVQHKGVGEGRRYFVSAMRNAMAAAGMKGNRRNIELLARGLINHVRLTDEFQDHVPDDVVPYSTLEHLYRPRPGGRTGDPRGMVGSYLERPYLHYSVGTRLRPSVLRELDRFGIKEVATHQEPPPFEPEMIRGMYSLQHDPDWMTRMYGSGLKSGLEDAVHRGATSDEEGTSFIPGLARAVDFGRVGQVRPPEPGLKPPPEGVPVGDDDAVKPVAPMKPSLLSGLNPFKAAADCTAPKVRTTKPVRQSRGKADQIVAMRQTRTIPKPGSKGTVKKASDPYLGSSTTTAAGVTHNLSGQSNVTATPKPPAEKTTPTAPNPPDAPKLAVPPTPASPPKLPEPVQGPPSPPGQVHPDRLPGAFGKGVNPEWAARFVGGESDSPVGAFGSVARLGTLLDPDAVGSLTSGQRYRARPQPTQTGVQENYAPTYSPHAPGGPTQSPKPEGPGWLSRMGESLGLSTPSADRTWGQSATAVPAQVGADTLLGFGLSEAWRAGKQRLGYAVPKSSVGGRLATSAKGGLAANVAFDLATSAPESVGNWANAVRGREFDPTETLGQQMNSLDIQRGNSAEGALQGLQSPVGTMQAGVHGIADTIDAKAQGDQARTQFNRLDAAGVQNMVRTADAHKRYFQALDRGHPFQVPWQDPETGLVHNFDNTAAYRSAISQATQYAGKTEFERQTQGQGLQDRVWHDAASRGMATGWATDVSRAVNPWTTPLVSGTGQRAVVPGTGVAIKSPTEMASLGRLVNPRRWLRGEFSVNPFVARE